MIVEDLGLLTKTIIMIKKIFMAGVISLLFGLFAVSCTEEEPIVNFAFEVYAEDGSDISGTQTVGFSNTLTLTFKAQSLASLDVETPDGWNSEVKMAAKKIIISAPAAEDKNAAVSGKVTMTAKPHNGEAKVISVDVAAVEGEVSLALPGVTENVKFRFAETQKFTLQSANVSEVEITAPSGWTVSTNSAVNELTVVAPERTNEAAELEGTISLLPKSVRGTVGASVSLGVYVSVLSPSLTVDKTEIHDVEYGSQTTVQASDVVNVVNVVVKSVPKGWDVAFDLASAKAVITAPSFEATDIEGAGNIVITAISESQDEVDYTIAVSLVGINNAADFLSFAELVNKATEEAPADLTGYKYNGEIVINNDIDLSEAAQPIFVTGTITDNLNGKNNTITVKIEADAEFTAIFMRFEAPAVVKNINLAGSITNLGHNVKVAGLSCYSKGATFENIRSSIALSQLGTGAGTSSGGLFGSIVGDEQGNGTYRNCHNTGALVVTSARYVGGLIGSIWDNTAGLMEDCSNTADMLCPFNDECDMGKGQYGGVVGATIGSNWKYYRCFNTGNISYTLDTKEIRAVGGFAGTVFGYFEDCYNTGNVINTKGTDAHKATRRIGGFGGASWSDCGFVATFKNCYNKGNVSDITNYIGGFIGIAEDGNADLYHIFENCYNTGNVTSLSKYGVSDAFGGFAGTLYSVNLLKNCKNSGKVVGYTRRTAGGLVGRAADYVQIYNCENTGDVYSGAVTGELSKDWSPVVGGICGIAGDGSQVNISNCKNPGKVTAMVQWPEAVASVYACEGVTRALVEPDGGYADKNTCDEATITASAGAKVVYMLPNEWTTNIPEGWL